MDRFLKITKGGMTLAANAADCWIVEGRPITWVYITTRDGLEGCEGHLSHRDYFSGPEGDRFLTEREERAAYALLEQAQSFVAYWEAVAWAQAGVGIDPRIGVVVRDGVEQHYAVIDGNVIEGDVANLHKALSERDWAEDRQRVA